MEAILSVVFLLVLVCLLYFWKLALVLAGLTLLALLPPAGFVIIATLGLIWYIGSQR